jgi:hypothetical protein
MRGERLGLGVVAVEADQLVVEPVRRIRFVESGHRCRVAE